MDDVNPNDSISNVAVGASKKSSFAGSKSRSTVSSTSSPRIRAETDMAALLAHQKLLREKHALEEEEAQQEAQLWRRKEQLRKRKEQLDLEMEIAASAAKINVLRISGTSQVSSTAARGADGMNSYFEKQKVPHSLNADAEIFAPVSAGQPSQYISASEQQPRSHLLDAQPKVRIVG